MKPQTTTFSFKPFSKKQRQILNWWTKSSPVKDCDGIIADGSIRSGKSLCMSLSFVLWAMSSFNGQSFGMCGKSIGSFRRNVLFWLKLMLNGRGYQYEDKRSDNLLIIYKGETINYFYIFGGRDERSQDFVQGITLAGVFLDEVALMPESFVNQVTGRCSVDGSKLWFNCNPSYPSHWFKTQWIDGRKDKNLLYLHFMMDDNLSLSEKIKERYKHMYAGVFYKRYILGLWALAEGLIYPMYEDAIEDPKDDNVSEYAVSCDYGTMNAFACLMWEKHGDTWYAVSEYYYSGREQGVTKTDDEYAKEVDKWLNDFFAKKKMNVPERLTFIVDPSAASFITLLRKQHKYKVVGARNNVIEGIHDTAMAMQLGLIKISPSLKNWKNEVEGYVWDDSETVDRPQKVNDHCLTGDTIVMTESGSLPISDLVGTEGKVWSYNTETGNAELKPYQNCRMTQEKAEIYEIETEDGRIIKCTAEHPILTQRGFVLAEYLEVSDKIIDIMDAISYNIDKP